MKTHVKLLVLAMVLVMFTFCLAACVGGGGGDTTTTTEAPVTTTAGSDFSDFSVEVEESVTYTGEELKNIVDAVCPQGTNGANAEIKYAMIDANGNVLKELAGTARPTDVGLYQVTVTFKWRKADRTDPLPDPVVKTFTVTPASLNAAADAHAFGTKDSDEFLYKPSGIEYDPLKSVLTGKLPKNVNVSASIVKLGDTATSTGTEPTKTAGKITSADGAGYFKVTVTYAEATGKDNYTDENTVSNTTIVYAREINKIVEKVDAFALSGDLSKYGDALFTTEYQDYIMNEDGKTFTVDTSKFIDPYGDKVPQLRMNRGASITDAMEKNAASAKFYAVWDGSFIYIAIEVTDNTPYARTAQYTAYPNPWINDNMELYYSFGGNAIPDVAGLSTYPTYKAVVRDSLPGAGGHNALTAQKSAYYSDIQCNVVGRTTGNNTYIIEYKFPACSESWSGTPGATGVNAFKTFKGYPLAAGDFLFLAYQLNDMTGLPYKRYAEGSTTIIDFKNGKLSMIDRWESPAEYDANITEIIKSEPNKYASAFDYAPPTGTAWYNFEYDAAPFVYSSGNRGAAWLDYYAPMVLQLGE